MKTRNRMKPGRTKTFTDEHLLGAFIGCLATLVLVHVGVRVGIASALATACICCLLFLVPKEKRHNIGVIAPAAYGGSFAGMTNLTSFGIDIQIDRVLLVALVVGLSVVTGLAFFFVSRMDKVFETPVGHGFGGRLGTVAALATMLFVLIVSIIGPPHWSVAWGDFGAIHLGAATLAAGLAAALVGAIGTAKLLREVFEPEAFHGTRILAAALFALAGLLALNILGWTSIVAAFYAACFLGMATPKILKSYWILAWACIPLVVIVQVVAAVLPGMGGGLGLSAFIAVTLMTAVSGVLHTSVGGRRLADVGAEE
jgi:hypothetical protein